MNKFSKPLYRKHNKLARGFHHNSRSGQYRHERNTSAIKNFEGTFKSMRRSKEGYDYTPLYKFLLASVGKNWDDVFSEAASRLDKKDPIFYMVDLYFHEGKRVIVRMGESTYYSTLTVVDGTLVKANENVTPPEKHCTCCTHTFNGEPY